MPLQEEYQITLDAFRGPLDLLLYLIRRAEVDIHDIPIAQITDQYLAFLKQLDDVDIEVAGEFLVMAATLIEIKSRTLMPPSKQGQADASDAPVSTGTTPGEMDASDPRYELVQQLLAYQRYRIASDDLEARRLAFLNRFPCKPARMDLAFGADQAIGDQASRNADDDAARSRKHASRAAAAAAGLAYDENAEFEEDDFELDSEPIEIDIEDAHVFDLAEAYERIMASIDFGRLGDHKVEIDDTPIALHQEDLLDRLNRSPRRRITLQEAFAGANTGQRIGLFLATLELTRLRRVTVEQDSIDSPIELVLNEDPTEALRIETDEIAHYEERHAHGEAQQQSP